MRILWRYIVNVLIALDQVGNALAGGDPDETLSSRCAKIMRRAESRSRRAPAVWHALAVVLEAIDPGHLKESLEEDEGSDAVVEYWKDQ